PYLIKLSEPMYDRIVKILPAKWVAKLDAYTSEAQQNKDNPLWKKILKEYNRILLTNSIILIAIALVFKYTFIPFLDAQIENVVWRNVVLISAATALSFPFLWAILVKKINIK